MNDVERLYALARYATQDRVQAAKKLREASEHEAQALENLRVARDKFVEQNNAAQKELCDGA